MPEAPMLDPPAPDPVATAEARFRERGEARIGGPDVAKAALAWGAQNLSDAEKAEFNRRLRGAPEESDAAADELVSRYVAAGGPRSLGGYRSLEDQQAGARAAAQNPTAAAVHMQRVAMTDPNVLTVPMQ